MTAKFTDNTTIIYSDWLNPVDSLLRTTTTGLAVGTITTDSTGGNANIVLDVPSMSATLSGTEYIAVKQGTSYLNTTIDSLSTYTLAQAGATVLSCALTGLNTTSTTPITATDTVLSAMGKLQAQVTSMLKTVTLTTTMPAAGSSTNSLAHGLTIANIMAIAYKITCTSGKYIFSPQGNPLFEHGVALTSSAVYLQTGGNASEVAGAAVSITISYVG